MPAGYHGLFILLHVVGGPGRFFFLVPGTTLAEIQLQDGTVGYPDKLKHGETGQGTNDYDAIFRILRSANFSGWISVEDGMDGLDELRRSVEFLKGKRREHYGVSS